jgi:hypothetical protein
MSLTAFKRKSVINYGSKRSGTAPGGVWLPQGPFGHSTNGLQLSIANPGPVGFSINGGRRNIGGVGREMKMSKSGTPYRGTEAIGFGGTYGSYPTATLAGSITNGVQTTAAVRPPYNPSPVVQPVLNSRIVDTMGTQYMYIKPSVLSTYGMLAKKYRWAYNGQYPNYWVQPNYTGNQTDSSSQGLYVQNKASANTCNLKVNNVGTYEGYIKRCGPTLCTPGRSTARFKYNDMARNGPYTKILYQPVTYGQYNLKLTRGCNNPVGPQKPFPYAVQTGTGIKTGGISVTNVGSSCGTSNVYLSPPEWYTNGPVNQLSGLQHPPQTIPFCK